MGITHASIIRASIIHLLLAMLCTAGLYAGTATAAVIPVTSCTDSGPGSLRALVATAADGDTIDFTDANCATIVLSGPIVVTQDNLEIGFFWHGNIVGGVQLDVQRKGRVILHTGTGLLRLEAIHLTNGFHAAEFATGGCLHSEGDVELYRASVSGCEALGQGGAEPMALGGGIHARNVFLHAAGVSGSNASGGNGYGGGISSEGRVRLLHAVLSGNGARSGGAVSTMDGITMTYSVVWGNTASDNAGIHSLAGSVTVAKSVLGVNVATRRCGALCVDGTGRTSVLDSTFTGNRARYLSVGDLSNDATISNSTITDNTDTSGSECVGVVRARGELTLISSIVAANHCNAPTTAYDIGGRTWEGNVLRGFSNFVGHSRLPLPPGTLRGDPMLDIIRQHGNLDLPVHMPLAESPVIDAGSNPYDRQYDQRGPGYPRMIGAAADIGAAEWSPAAAAGTRVSTPAPD